MLASTPALAVPAAKPGKLKAAITRRVDRGVLPGIGDAIVLSTRKTTVPAGDRITSWSIDFGDHTRKSGKGTPPKDVNHPYARPGTYRVVLRITDARHATAKAVYVEKTDAYFLPIGSAGWGGTGIVYPWQVDVGATFSINVTWSAWGRATAAIDFGDGTPPTTGLNAPTALLHRYAAAGPYTITETVVDGVGGTTSSTRSIVAEALGLTVKPAATGQTTVLASDQSDADGPVSPAVFAVTLAPGTHAANYYTFDPGNGDPIVSGSGAPPPVGAYYYDHAGHFTATMTVHLTEGPTLQATVPVDVADPPTLAVTQPGSPPTAGSPYELTLTATLAPGTAWADYGVTWDEASDPDGQFTDGVPPPSLSHTYDMADVGSAKTVDVEVDDDHGGYAVWTGSTGAILAGP